MTEAPPPELHVLDDPARAAAELLLDAARKGGHLVLAGGSTPRAAYERLAGEDLGGATLWFGDERCVAMTDERSNYGMVRGALLDRLAGEPRAVHRIAGEDGPEAAADAYERELRDAFAGGPPAFDLVLLGLGPDAHTASLFPGQDTLRERERLAVGVAEAGLEPFVPRVTLTLPALGAARRVVVLVSGEGKADAVRRAFGPDRTPSLDAPASLLTGRVTVLLDAAAAAHVDAQPEEPHP
jgi:6-phosphogluconolactonase